MKISNNIAINFTLLIILIGLCDLNNFSVGFENWYFGKLISIDVILRLGFRTSAKARSGYCANKSFSLKHSSLVIANEFMLPAQMFRPGKARELTLVELVRHVYAKLWWRMTTSCKEMVAVGSLPVSLISSYPTRYPVKDSQANWA